MTDDYNKLRTHVGVTAALTELARKKAFIFYWFNPAFQRPEFVEDFYKRSEYKDFSAVLYVNVDGARRIMKDKPQST